MPADSTIFPPTNEHIPWLSASGFSSVLGLRERLGAFTSRHAQVAVESPDLKMPLILLGTYW